MATMPVIRADRVQRPVLLKKLYNVGPQRPTLCEVGGDFGTNASTADYDHFFPDLGTSFECPDRRHDVGAIATGNIKRNRLAPDRHDDRVRFFSPDQLIIRLGTNADIDAGLFNAVGKPLQEAK